MPVLVETVTVCVLSEVMMLPKKSSSATIGCVANATPAVAVLDGCVVTTSWVAAAGETTMLLDAVEVTPASLVKASVIVSALLYDRPLNVAMPLTRVIVSVLPWIAAVPLPVATVIVWVLSVVMMLPN